MSKMSALASFKLLLAKKRVRQWLAATILLATVIVFAHFFVTHPAYWQQLKQVSAWTIIVVLAGNFLLLAVLAGIYRTCIELCNMRIGGRENFLLTAYSSIVNFFGPLQSGPGVRAVYLKTKLGIRLRDYTLATLLYYGLFAIMNVGFLFVGTRPWWQTIAALLAATGFSLFVIRWFKRKDRHAGESKFILSGRLIAVLAVLSFLQIFIQALVFYFELHTVNSGIHFSQAITYTGAADLAIFVSLTPGAIGFRESFLVFSHSLHHISTANILSANLIDRGVYVVFLGLLFLLAISMHAKQRLNLTKLRRPPASSVDE